MSEPSLTPEAQVSANVRLLRARRDWTQRELADRSGLMESRVWATEVGRRRITVDDVVAFAGVFGVTPGRIMSDSPERASTDPVYKVTATDGGTQSVAADRVDPGESWTLFYLRETCVFMTPTARILGIRLLPEGASNV